MSEAPTKAEMVRHILLTSPQAVEDLMSGKLKSINVPYATVREDTTPPDRIEMEGDRIKQDVVYRTITLTKEDFDQ